MEEAEGQAKEERASAIVMANQPLVHDTRVTPTEESLDGHEEALMPSAWLAASQSSLAAHRRAVAKSYAELTHDPLEKGEGMSALRKLVYEARLSDELSTQAAARIVVDRMRRQRLCFGSLFAAELWNGARCTRSRAARSSGCTMTTTQAACGSCRAQLASPALS